LFSLLSNVVLVGTILLIILSWVSGNKAAKLLYGGSAERLNRKVRKQMVWAAYITLSSTVILMATFLIVQSMSPIFWEDRVLLHLPLVLLPFLSVWILAVPRLWKIWQATRKLTGAPLSVDIRKQVAHPLVIVPFQMTTMSAAALLYLLLVTPVPLQFANAIIPIVLWLTATMVVWYVHNQRWLKVSQPDAVLVLRPWKRRLRALGIFFVKSRA
jgi:hypothetical protein